MGYAILTVYSIAFPVDYNTDSIFTKSRPFPKSSEAINKTSLQKINQMKNISNVLLRESK